MPRYLTHTLPVHLYPVTRQHSHNSHVPACHRHVHPAAASAGDEPRTQACHMHCFMCLQAASHFWVLDAHGLVTHHRRELPPHVQSFARWDRQSTDGESLLDVVKRVKPTGARSNARCGERLFYGPCSTFPTWGMPHES
jgi:Malic enzyme, NAD binding domain